MPAGGFLLPWPRPPAWRCCLSPAATAAPPQGANGRLGASRSRSRSAPPGPSTAASARRAAVSTSFDLSRPTLGFAWLGAAEPDPSGLRRIASLRSRTCSLLGSKERAVAGLVCIIAVIGNVPYIALWLKAVSTDLGCCSSTRAASAQTPSMEQGAAQHRAVGGGRARCSRFCLLPRSTRASGTKASWLSPSGRSSNSVSWRWAVRRPRAVRRLQRHLRPRRRSPGRSSRSCSTSGDRPPASIGSP